MMRLNEKSRLSIKTHIRSLAERSFDEDTVKLLLIDIRDFAPDLADLREVCHFVAHPERNQGSIHNRILSRFLRIRYMNEVMKRAMADCEIHHPGRTEDFGAYVQRTIPLDHYQVFDKKYFEILLGREQDDFDESFYAKVFNSCRSEIARIIESNYKKVDGKYRLRPNYDKSVTKLVFVLETSIQFRPLLSAEKILEELKVALCRLATSLDVTLTEIEDALSDKEGLFLAILSLLHDVTFVRDDTAIGRSFLSAEKTGVGLLCDFYPDNGSFIFSLVETSAKFEEYSEGEVIEGELKGLTLRRSESGRLVFKS